MKIDKRDKVFSLLIRERACQRCEKCGTSERLTASHHISRRFLALRWEPDNACCHCWPCHTELTYKPHDHYAWIVKFIGEKKFTELRERSRGVCKLTSTHREAIHDNLKSSWAWMQQQRREGVEGRLEFDSPYEGSG